MKKKDVKNWLKKNVEKIQHKFAIDNWIINYVVKEKHKEAEDTAAEVSRLTFKYKIVDLTFYSSNISNLIELKEVLQHEFYHVLLSPLDAAFEDYRGDHEVTDDHVAYRTAMEELTVWNLEQHYKRLKK